MQLIILDKLVLAFLYNLHLPIKNIYIYIYIYISRERERERIKMEKLNGKRLYSLHKEVWKPTKMIGAFTTRYWTYT